MSHKTSVRWFYYVVLALALFVAVFAAVTQHWIIAGAAGFVLAFFVALPDEGL
jgi:hypothetical protein